MDYLLNLRVDTSFSASPITVLNLIINGLPSKPTWNMNGGFVQLQVLNLIINGLPSKLRC